MLVNHDYDIHSILHVNLSIHRIKYVQSNYVCQVFSCMYVVCFYVKSSFNRGGVISMYARKHTTPFSFKSTEERSLCPLFEYYSFPNEQ